MALDLKASQEFQKDQKRSKVSHKTYDENISTAINKMRNNGNFLSNNNLKTLIISPRIEAQNSLNLKVKQVISVTSFQNQAKSSRLSLNKNDILLFKPNPQFATQKSQIPPTTNLPLYNNQIKPNPGNIKRPDSTASLNKQPKPK